MASRNVGFFVTLHQLLLDEENLCLFFFKITFIYLKDTDLECFRLSDRTRPDDKLADLQLSWNRPERNSREKK